MEICKVNRIATLMDVKYDLNEYKNIIHLTYLSFVRACLGTPNSIASKSIRSSPCVIRSNLQMKDNIVAYSDLKNLVIIMLTYIYIKLYYLFFIIRCT